MISLEKRLSENSQQSCSLKEFWEKEKALIKSYEGAPSWHGRFAEFQGIKKRLNNLALQKIKELKKQISESYKIVETLEDNSVKKKCIISSGNKKIGALEVWRSLEKTTQGNRK